MYYLCSENKGADQLRGYAKLICVFVFAYAKSRFSHGEAQIIVITKSSRYCKNAEMTILCLILHCKNEETTILLSFLHFYSVESYNFCYFFSPIQICFRLNKKNFF